MDKCLCLFVCLLSFFFNHMETSSLQVKNFKFDLYSALLAIWALLSHTFCDTGHPFTMPSVWQWSCFYDLCLSRLGFEHLTFRMRGERTNRLRHYRGLVIMRLPPNYKNADWLNYYMVCKVVSVIFKPFNVWASVNLNNFQLHKCKLNKDKHRKNIVIKKTTFATFAKHGKCKTLK